MGLRSSRINYRDPSDGKTALHSACYEGNTTTVKLLLKAGADVLLKDENGDSAVHYASHENNTGTFDLLLQFGAKVNETNAKGRTALHVAATLGFSDIVALLLKNGATAKLQDADGDTPLHDAIYYQNKILKTLVSAFLSNGKDILEVQDMVKEKAEGYRETCNRLVDAMTVTDLRAIENGKGFTCFNWAALHENHQVIERFISRSREFVNLQKGDGFSALHLASLNGNFEVVQVLVDKGRADVNLKTNRNQTALHLAVDEAHCDIIEFLARKGANVDEATSQKHTVLHFAINVWRTEKTVALKEGSRIKYWLELLQALGHEKKVYLAIACFLIADCNADATLKDQDEDTPIGMFLSNLYSSDLNSTQREDLKDFILNLFRNNPVHELLNQISTLMETYDIGEAGAGGLMKEGQAMEGRAVAPGIFDCIVCRDKLATIRFEPCGHQITCDTCCQVMRKCQLCVEPIEKRLIMDLEGKTMGEMQLSLMVGEGSGSSEEVPSPDNECEICFDRTRNVTFSPCGHGCCAHCADRISRCHKCNGDIVKKILMH